MSLGDDPWPEPYQDSPVVCRNVRIVRYAEDGRTPVVVEYEVLDTEGTLWTTRRDFRTGEISHSHLPGDR